MGSTASNTDQRSAPLQPLSGLDALFLQLEAPAMPMHVGSLNLLQLPRGVRGGFAPRVRALLAARLHLAPALTRVLLPAPLGLANPAWAEAGDIDLDWHVRTLRLPRPGTLAQLEACVARLHAQPLPRTRPLWQLTVIEGLGGALAGHVGYYAKLHHAAIDGQAGVALAQALLDTTPQPRAVPTAAAQPRLRPPGALAQLRAAAAHSARQWQHFAQLLPEAARLLATARRELARAAGGVAPAGDDSAAAAKRVAHAAGHGRAAGAVRAADDPVRAGGASGEPAHRFRLLGPRTPLNVVITARRAFTTSSIPLAEVKQVAKALGVSVNDVVLACCSGALRDWLAAHGGVPARSLTAGVPVSLRMGGDGSASNQVSMLLADLATHEADPARRLAAIHRSMGVGKALSGRLQALLPTDYPSLGAAWLVSGVTRALTALAQRLPTGTHLPSPAQLAISNVPGPPAALYLAGARLRHYWPLSIVTHGVALNITVQSYDGGVDFGLVACPRAVPDLRRFKRHLARAFAELQALAAAASRLPGEATNAAPAAGRAATPSTAASARAPAARRRARSSAASPAASTATMSTAASAASAAASPAPSTATPRSRR